MQKPNWKSNWKPVFFDKNNGEKFGTNNPREDLMDLLVDKTRALGHILTFNEASVDPDMVVPNSYAFYFGSFSTAAKIAWSKVNSSQHNHTVPIEQSKQPSEIPERPRQFTEQTYRKEVNFIMGGIQRKKQLRGKGRKYTTEEVQDALMKFYESTHRLPLQTDTAGSCILPSWVILVKYLGPKDGWQAIIDKKLATANNGALPRSGSYIAKEAKMPTIVNTDDITEKESSQHGNIEVKTSREEQTNIATIEVKITLPDREKPIFITLTV